MYAGQSVVVCVSIAHAVFFFPAKETAVKPLLSNDALSTDTSLPELSRSGRGKGSDQADSERVATDWARAVPVRSAPLNSKQ